MKARVIKSVGKLLGSIDCPSGNRCSVRMRVEKAQKISLSFSWDHPPGPDDLEEWLFNVLGGALEAATQEALKYRGAVEAIRRCEAEGLVERRGITESGEWLFQRTDRDSTDRERRGIVSLAIARDRKRRGRA